MAGTTAAALRNLWRRLGAEFSTDWTRYAPAALDVVNRGLGATVRTALPYIGGVLDETGQDAPATGSLNVGRFTALLADGRTAGDLVGDGLVALKTTVADGVPASVALRQVEARMTAAVLTTLADKRREVYGADIVRRPKVAGYTRMLNPPSCSRCVILAGKWFRWNTGFQRHPRCDCIQIPSSEVVAGDFQVDPNDYFNSLTLQQQSKTFGKNTAQAIRDGADITTVVNLKGVTKLATGYRSRGIGQITVDDIYRTAGSREQAIRMLDNAGYLARH